MPTYKERRNRETKEKEQGAKEKVMVRHGADKNCEGRGRSVRNCSRMGGILGLEESEVRRDRNLQSLGTANAEASGMSLGLGDIPVRWR